LGWQIANLYYCQRGAIEMGGVPFLSLVFENWYAVLLTVADRKTAKSRSG
jgi:hypothetical protein